MALSYVAGRGMPLAMVLMMISKEGMLLKTLPAWPEELRMNARVKAMTVGIPERGQVQETSKHVRMESENQDVREVICSSGFQYDRLTQKR